MKLVIYVVDDQRVQAEATATVLRRAGHNVTVETNSTQALQTLLSDVEIDVTFLDIVMPDMLGSHIYETCEKQAPARCERIIFLTGYAEMAPSWIRRTGRLVLEKPCTPDRIVRAAEEMGRLVSPRGPNYAVGVRREHRSHPELQSSLAIPEEDEATGVTLLARNGDVTAVKVKTLEEKVGKLEKHFEPEGTVDKIAKDMHAARTWLKSIVPVTVIIGALLAALMYIMHAEDRRVQEEQFRRVLQEKSP